MSDSLQPHEPQHARPPCPSPTPGVYSNSCPLSRWCHPTISSSVVPFSSCLQSFPASGSSYESKKKWYKWTLHIKQRLTDLENDLWLPGGRLWEGHVHTALLKWITNKDLLYSTWISSRYYAPACMGGGVGGEWIHVYVWLSPLAVHLKLPQHC